MNWYVKYEGTGEISGPMSKDDALSMAEQADGMVFNERIFEPEFVTTEEVELLIEELRQFAADRDSSTIGPSSSHADMCKHAADALILLSRKEPISVSDNLSTLLAELQSIREAMVIIRSGEDDAIGSLCKRVSDALVDLSREKLVTGSIRGGVLDFNPLPPGVRIKIADYDVGDAVSHELQRDGEGACYIPLEFIGGG